MIDELEGASNLLAVQILRLARLLVDAVIL